MRSSGSIELGRQPRTPKPGAVLWCDFDLTAKPRIAGSPCSIPDVTAAVPPEIGKRDRPVVVISRRYHKRNPLGPFIVVPISTTAPLRIERWHVLLSGYPFLDQTKSTWAKADLVSSVSGGRLDRRRDGRGEFVDTVVSEEDLRAIRCAVLYAMGLGKLVEWWNDEDALEAEEAAASRATTEA